MLFQSPGDLKADAKSMIERPGNVLKLLGDQYIARVYSLLGRRFHLEEWEQSNRRSLEVVEGVYAVISDRAASQRTEFLEIIVILLILFEILIALVRHGLAAPGSGVAGPQEGRDDFIKQWLEVAPCRIRASYSQAPPVPISPPFPN